MGTPIDYGFPVRRSEMITNVQWIGNLCLTRRTVQPFDPKIGPVLQAFAGQAAIAVANSWRSSIFWATRSFSSIANRKGCSPVMTTTISKSGSCTQTCGVTICGFEREGSK